MGDDASSLFVGRRFHVDEVLGLLRERPATSTVAFVTGMPGIGKSYLLDRIDAEAARLGDEFVVFPRRSLVPDYAMRDTANEEAALRRTLTRSVEARLQFLAVVEAQDHAWPREFSSFALACERSKSAWQSAADAKAATAAATAAQGNATTAGRDLTIKNATFTSHLHLASRGTGQLNDLLDDLDDKFVDAWLEWSARRSVLMTIDDYELLTGTRLGTWLLDLVHRLPHLVVVAASSSSPADLPLERSDVRHWELTAFTADEVEQYYAERFAPLKAADGIAQVTYRYTDGHPGGVDLVADLVHGMGVDTVEPVDLGRRLDLLPPDQAARWSTLVRAILEAVSDEPLVQAAEACAAVHSFDAPLLAALVGRAGRDVDNIISSLQGVGVVHELYDDVTRLGTGRYRLRGFIRRAMAQSLRSMAPQRLEGYHRQAADHYAGCLASIEDDSAGEYDSWFRYERPEWQRYKSEWLYHTSQVDGAGSLSRARFTLVFLEAFYWWGCYVPFEFSRELLLDWVNTDFRYSMTTGDRCDPAEDENDAELADCLFHVLDHYPMGHRKDSPDWDDIYDHLLLVRELCGVGRLRAVDGSDAEAQDRRRLDAFLHVFLAHCGHYAEQPPADAEDDFEAALAIFEEQGDGWMVAWIQFELADHVLDRGQAERALELVRLSARRLIEVTLPEGGGDVGAAGLDWDEELIADLWRLRGDAAWGDGDVDGAVDAYVCAVRHAYRQLGVRPPDAYTARFYEEMTSRLAERLVELAGAGRIDEAQVHAGRAHAELAPRDPMGDVRGALDAGDAAAVAAAVFPAGPEPAELHTKNSRMMRRWLRFDVRQPETGPDVARLAGEPLLTA